MRRRPIYTVQDALDVVHEFGITDASWAFPGSASSFAVFLWTHEQVLSPADIPNQLEAYIEARFPELPMPNLAELRVSAAA